MATSNPASPPSTGKSKAVQSKEIFEDFQRFLGTEAKSIEQMLVTEVKEWYAKQYKIYRQQLFPQENLPTFYKLFKVLYQQNVAHFLNNKIVLGRDLKKFSKKQQQRAKIAVSFNDIDACIERSIKSSPDKAIKHGSVKNVSKTHMAVDQHLTFKTGSVKVIDQPGFQGDAELWKHITTTKGKSSNIYYCAICHSKINSARDIEHHVNGRRHRLASTLGVLKTKKKELLQGIAGITVSSTKTQVKEDGVIYAHLKENEVEVVNIVLTNEGDAAVELAHCEILKRCRVFTLTDSKKVTDGMGSAMILPGKSYTILVRMKPKHVGSYHCPVMFHMVTTKGDNTKQTGYILRYLHCKCSNTITNELEPTSAFKKPPRTNKKKGPAKEIIPGLRLPKFSGDGLERKIKLKMFDVPSDTRKMINRGLTDKSGLSDQEQEEMENLRCLLEKDLSMQSYVRYFRSLLYFEEVQMEVDIRRYDLENVTLRQYKHNRSLLLLKVPGLAENRPSVLRGDWLYVSLNDSQVEYQGFVHDVLQEEVALGFSDKFRSGFIAGQLYNVRFVFNRLPIRLQHRACVLADELSLDPILFPAEANMQRDQLPLPDLKLYNADLENNIQQMCAVQHIVAGTSKPAPYLVFGPPGTGKTVTIVEAIKQVLKCNRDCHILACTPSNSAADLIAQRLIKHVSKSEVLRLNAASRSLSGIPDTIKEVCNFSKEIGQIYYPSKNAICDYKIIITTLVTAGRLVSASFPPGHFSHIFIDEAGHAPEPEALIAIAGIMEVNPALKTGGQVVIAGDPKQLGPVLRSPLAIKYGLSTSMLERLMDRCPLYQPRLSTDGHRTYDARVITKLLNNYRSHPAILELPNKMFYDAELKPCANKIAREKLCAWEGLKRQGFPVMFHAVIGEDKREDRSPSFFNTEEVFVVTNYVKDLIACKKRGINLKMDDIGVISPYRKQVQKLRQILNKMGLDKVSVGSVEEFQGQERTVIIVSTVRSNHEYLPLDMQYKLGFLRNPKRFNVTVTRAKALLIVVGNPNTLSRDEYWKQLIDYCEENGSYVGEERLSDEEEMEDLIQRLSAVQLIDGSCQLTSMESKENEDKLEDQSEYNEQAWRSAEAI